MRHIILDLLCAFMYLSHLKFQFIVWELGLQGCRVCFFRWECFYSYTITVGVCCTTSCLFRWCGLSIYIYIYVGSSKIMPPQMSIEDHPNLWWSEHIWEFDNFTTTVSTNMCFIWALPSLWNAICHFIKWYTPDVPWQWHDNWNRTLWRCLSY